MAGAPIPAVEMALCHPRRHNLALITRVPRPTCLISLHAHKLVSSRPAIPRSSFLSMPSPCPAALIDLVYTRPFSWKPSLSPVGFMVSASLSSSVTSDSNSMACSAHDDSWLGFNQPLCTERAAGTQLLTHSSCASLGYPAWEEESISAC